MLDVRKSVCYMEIDQNSIEMQLDQEQSDETMKRNRCLTIGMILGHLPCEGDWNDPRHQIAIQTLTFQEQ